MKFTDFKQAVDKRFSSWKGKPLFVTNTDKQQLWDTYLNSFPEGSNPIYKVRTEHDCNCCKNYIRQMGNVVAIVDGKLQSLWDIEVGGSYQVVADAMSTLVKSGKIENVFLKYENTIGTDKNHVQSENGVITHNHFYTKLPTEFVVSKTKIGTLLGETKTSKDVFTRALETISISSVELVLELIAQNSIYRGQEHKATLDSYLKVKKAYDLASNKDMFVWLNLKSTNPAVVFIRNSVIGTLLVDLADGKDLEVAVKAFESKVAPSNYKRPTALVTKKMIENAHETMKELGLMSALERRYAKIEDIDINNVIYANRNVKNILTGNIFEELANKAIDNVPNFDKVESVSIDDFLTKIVPSAESVELFLENSHATNLVSLIAPVHLDSANIFKWDNKFSWSYTGDNADSIKERVKKAGGQIVADIRVSLSWYNYDDLDLYLKEITAKGNYEIYYGNRSYKSPNGGQLDVDMNTGGGTRSHGSRNAVENIVYTNGKTLTNGRYIVQVHNYRRMETIDVGCEVEIEVYGKMYNFVYSKPIKDEELIDIAVITVHNGQITVDSDIASTVSSKEIWNLTTQKFHQVSAIMLSPNYWGDNNVGNKHFFFMLENCKNDDKARGFYNEFLKGELDKHRKVFEIVGSKMKTDEEINQLSGVGYSSTQKNHVFCRVKGKFNRVVKVQF